jgi:hypothetical protein
MRTRRFLLSIATLLALTLLSGCEAIQQLESQFGG